jgi:hypothetical protein
VLDNRMLFYTAVSDCRLSRIRASANHATVNTTRLPVPHLEHPKLPNEDSLRISFLDEQTVQTGTTVFATQISYTFEDWTGEHDPSVITVHHR